MVESVGAEDFEARVGDAHWLVPLGIGAGAPVEMVLDSVSELPVGNPRRRAPFDIVFRAPLGTDLGQGTFRVEHADHESLDLFLVPIGPADDGDGMLYQAIFG